MFAGFLFLLLLTGGSTNNDSKDDNNNGGSSRNTTELPELQEELEPNHSFEGSGKTINTSERGLNVQLSDKDNNDSSSGSSWNTTELPELQEELEPNESFEGNGETFNSSEQQRLPGHPSMKKGPCDSDRNKSKFLYQDVLKCLKLTENKELYPTVRPTKRYNKPTSVYVRLSILAILDVVSYLNVVNIFKAFLRLQREIDQTFVSFVGIYLKWEDPHIYWKPHHFDGLDMMTVSANLLWKPDVMIKEMIEKDKAVPNPFITIRSTGFVEYVRDFMVVSTCKMQIYNFPFDIQTCNLSLKSVVYREEELNFQVMDDSDLITDWTREMMSTESEWQLIDMTVQKGSVPHFRQNQSVIIYTIRMRRCSALYIVNFLVPIIFFFCLDLASFLMSDSGGEKVSFKVTVLLAVTVMQLILNEILPSSSDRIPLIAVYCIGIFVLIMISLLETILVMYLIEKDKQGNNDGDVKKWTRCACAFNVCDEPPSELLSVAKEEIRIQLMEESNSLEKLPDELSEAVKTLSLLLSRKEERKPDYWTRLTRKLDNIFFVVYVTVSTLFLVVIFSVWINANN